MNTKIFENSHFTPKGDYEVNWNKAVGYIPLDKEIIIYKKDETHPAARFKVGDGKTVVQDLPFSGTDIEAIEKLIDEKGELLVEYVDNAVAALPQSDWNQNNENAIDYIKNRPFYENISTLFEWNGQLAGHDYILTNPENGYDHYYLVKVSDKSDYTLDDFRDAIFVMKSTEFGTEEFTIDDEDFEYNIYAEDLPGGTLFDFDGLIVLSVYDHSMLNDAIIEEGLPFSVTVNGLYVSGWGSGILHDYLASIYKREIIKIDTKFLPDGMENLNETVTNLYEIGNAVLTLVVNITEGNNAVYLNDSFTGIFKIDWGDGKINNKLSHFYDELGEFSIKIYGATTIGQYAFASCTSLTNVEIGDGVTTIGERAFASCTSLTSVVIGDSVTSIGSDAFRDCTSLTNVVIPDSVTSIGDWAFAGCDGLTSVVIPDSVTSISSSAFRGCDNLTSIEIPDSVTSIGDYAFYSCSSLTSVEIGDGVTTIGERAFAYCDSLTNLVIGNSVTSIGDWAFAGCDGLTSVTCPAFAISYIHKGNLQTVVITSGESIGDAAFSGCDGLTSVEIGDGVTSIGDYAFSKCSSLTSVVIGDSVTSIGSDAFAYCSSLTSVVIPDSVTSIGDWAFDSCSSLTNVEIGDGVTTIGERAFSICSSLTNVEIGDGVTTIGKSAFSSCYRLTSVTFKSFEPLTYDSSWFNYCLILKNIYVPYGCKQAYIDKWTADGAEQAILDKIVESDREAMMSDLNSKLDKIGGAITGDLSIGGNLTVAGTTTTKNTETINVKDNTIVANSDGIELLEEAGFVVKTNTTDAYGIMYDPVGDGVKIGLGSFDEAGKFNYTEGEDQFLATRADTIVDGHTVVWDDDTKQLVDSGVDHSEYVKFTDYATNEKFGLVRLFETDQHTGLNFRKDFGGALVVVPATKTYIDIRDGAAPITPKNLDYAVKVGITTNTEEWTDDDKAAACETIGAMKKSPLARKLYGTNNANEQKMWGIATSAAISDSGYIPQYHSQTSGVGNESNIPDGVLITNTPVNPYHCATKKYVDDLVGNINTALEAILGV